MRTNADIYMGRFPDQEILQGGSQMKLKDIREAYGMTRAELERRIGVADRRLVRYESGETPQNNMDLIIAYRISKVLKCKMEDLLELEDEKK